MGVTAAGARPTDERPVRFAVLGTSRIAGIALMDVVRRYQGAGVVAVASRDQDRARAYAGQWGIPSVEPTYEHLLARPDVDAVYIPLPASLHCRWAINAARAGKHVLVEKPFSTDAAEAEVMTAAGADSGVLMVEAFHYLYHPCMRRVLELVRQGELGRLERITAVFQYNLNHVQGDTAVYTSPELGGGALFHWGSYCVHFCRSVAGGEPTVVSASLQAGATGVDTGVEANLQFDQGLQATMVASSDSRWSMYVEVEGTTGRLRLNSFVVPHLYKRDPLVVEASGRLWTENPGDQTTYYYQLAAFCEAVRNRLPLPTAGADSIANMRVIDQIFDAVRPRKGSLR
jgi:predicted dehydrogenase